jgi:hypothetical protein
MYNWAVSIKNQTLFCHTPTFRTFSIQIRTKWALKPINRTKFKLNLATPLHFELVQLKFELNGS